MTRLGSTVGPAVGGVLAISSYRLPFWTQACVFALAAAILLVHLDVGKPETEAPQTSAANAESAKPEASSSVAPTPFVFPREARVLLVVVVALMFARSAREILLPLRGADLQLTPATIGLVAAASFTLDTALVPLAGYLMDAHGRKIACVPSLAIQALGFATLSRSNDLRWLVASSCLLGIGNGLSNGWIQTVGADLAPPGQRPHFLGYWSAGLNAGSAVGPLLVGIVSEHTGTDVTAAVVVSAFVALGGLWYLFFGVETLVQKAASGKAMV
jgi:MFS family permease